MQALREIALDCPLTEEVKWGQPCYASEGGNVVLIHGFKDYCALLFMKGALMPDPHKLLIQQTERVQSGRQIRFTSLKQITAARAIVKAYIEDAIAVEKAGLKVAKRTTADFPYPEELLQKLEESPDLRAAFSALTPGRQRGYLLHFAAAKQAKTRLARIEKCAPAILAGKGLDD
ncbi:MAG: YdeI/OmpD-associated family protein [Pseudomonadota bacterium]|nr:YdeI/OmpD-associated family protein [Pseudomonadota bacterium]